MGLARLDNSVAVITGASSGIGEQTAWALVDEGATVALVARRIEKLRELAAEIERKGGRALAIEADITDAGQVDAAIQQVVADAGGIDVLVNSAGMLYTGSAADAEVDQWQRMVDINVMGVLHCSHAALPHLLRSAEGSRGVADIVNISSVAARVVRPDNAVYAATKHAVNAFSESLRKEVTSRHVRVCVVEPGMVRTEMTNGSDMARDEFVWLQPEDIADAVTYVVTRPKRVSVNEFLVRPTEQER
jgi:NADP-dependent 3-hydroxy acid dehydrogenase YdfG